MVCLIILFVNGKQISLPFDTVLDAEDAMYDMSNRRDIAHMEID